MIAKKLLNNIQKRGIYQVNQNNYVGQSPVEIANDTIFLEASFVNKVNSIDNLQQDIRQNTNSITTNTSSINTINNSINGISTQLTTLNNSITTTNNNVSTNTQNITNNTNNITANTQNITTNTQNIAANTSSIEANTQEIEAVKTKAETNENNISTINTTLQNKLDTATYNQEKANFAKLNQANTFTQATTFNNGIVINSQAQDFTWETTRTWANNVDNTVAKTKDFKYVRQFQYTSGIVQPTTNWNTTSWNWTLSGLNTNGLHEILVIFSIGDVAYSLNAKVVWKNGLVTSRSPIMTTTDLNGNTYDFIFVIKNNNKLYVKHKKSGGSNNIQWVRGWIVRGPNLPWKMNEQW